jgi:hypothetical protein
MKEKTVRRTVHELLEHYHVERNHQGLANRLMMEPEAQVGRVDGKVECRARLGGLLRYYDRDALFSTNSAAWFVF